MDGGYVRALGDAEGAGRLVKPLHVDIEGGRVYVVEAPDEPRERDRQGYVPSGSGGRIVVFSMEGAHLRDLKPPGSTARNGCGMLRGVRAARGHVYVAVAGLGKVLRVADPFSSPSDR